MQTVPDPSDLFTAAAALLCPKGEVHELRALGVPQGRGSRAIVSGYYDSSEALARDAAHLDDKEARGVYVTLNPADPRLLSRRANRCEPIRDRDATTTDRDIVRRSWLFVDLDPVRPSGIGSTHEEHTAALARACQIADWLAVCGWPQPVSLDSGNGSALLFRIDLPNAADALRLVAASLAALAVRFDDDIVAVDATVSNAARIVRLPGTLNRKGDSTASRPHRRACILAVPEPVEAVSRELLEALARHAPAAPGGAS